MNYNKSVTAILTPGKINLTLGNTFHDDKRVDLQEYVTSLNVYIPNNTCKGKHSRNKRNSQIHDQIGVSNILSIFLPKAVFQKRENEKKS